ncbi:MAG TPA: hypothetical protein VK911_02685 [Vicinamibacterales bacterium]|nr:hypothetical protein [Vicinamibacterales bacterium]
MAEEDVADRGESVTLKEMLDAIRAICDHLKEEFPEAQSPDLNQELEAIKGSVDRFELTIPDALGRPHHLPHAKKRPEADQQELDQPFGSGLLRDAPESMVLGTRIVAC